MGLAPLRRLIASTLNPLPPIPATSICGSIPGRHPVSSKKLWIALLKNSSHVGSIVFAIKIIEGMCNTVGFRPLLGIATGSFSSAPDYRYLGKT